MPRFAHPGARARAIVRSPRWGSRARGRVSPEFVEKKRRRLVAECEDFVARRWPIPGAAARGGEAPDEAPCSARAPSAGRPSARRLREGVSATRDPSRRFCAREAPDRWFGNRRGDRLRLAQPGARGTPAILCMTRGVEQARFGSRLEDGRAPDAGPLGQSSIPTPTAFALGMSWRAARRMRPRVRRARGAFIWRRAYELGLNFARL